MASLTLNSTQISTYLDHIKLPGHYRDRLLQDSNQIPRDLDLLSTLQAYHICAIPYENLGLHYAQGTHISLDLQTLYQKCTRNGRGGYCMENTIFFNHVLRGLGFDAYMTGARARPRIDGVPSGDYTGWMHAVNIVTLPGGTRYMVDVGFGGDLATKPLPLIAGQVTRNLGPQEVRLEYDRIPYMLSHHEQKCWIYQYRNGADQAWHASFCFTETEFLQRDLEVMNFYTSQDPSCFQTFTVIAVRFLMREEEVKEGAHSKVGEIYGKTMLVNGDVKQNLGGKTSLIRTCRSESERVETLRELFAIVLDEAEIEGIKGRVAELGQS